MVSFMNFKNKVLPALTSEVRKKVRLLFLCTVFLSACDVGPRKERPLVKNRVFVTEDSLKPEPTAIKKDTSYLEYIFQGLDLVDIQSLDTSIRVHLQYADTSNFLKRAFYDGLRKAYFNCETALRIAAAQYFLQQNHPDLSLVIYDASRPQHIQQMMWDSLQLPGKEKTSYLSAPDATSLHNYGCAVDCGLVNTKTGEVLDMGTGFDSFEKLSQPVLESRFLKSGELSETAFMNRQILRNAMKRARMNNIPTEWWHFSSCSRVDAMARYRLIR